MADANRTNGAIAITGANVPATITALASRILKITIGHLVDGAATPTCPLHPHYKPLRLSASRNRRLASRDGVRDADGNN
jgi:hypothetical protein